MTPPLQSVACRSCHMIQVVPVQSARGPALRLRCLSCHTPLRDADEVTRISGRLEVPTAPVDREWFALLDGEVAGPMSREAIISLHAQGELDDEGMVWHEGFGSWARLADTASFRRRVGGRRIAPRRPEVLDLTDDVDLVELPPPARPLPPPLPPGGPNRLATAL